MYAIVRYNCQENKPYKIVSYQIYGIEINKEEWEEKFDTIDSDFRVYKVKDHSQLAIGEKIDFLSVVDVADHQTEKGGEE